MELDGFMGNHDTIRRSCLTLRDMTNGSIDLSESHVARPMTRLTLVRINISVFPFRSRPREVKPYFVKFGGIERGCRFDDTTTAIHLSGSLMDSLMLALERSRMRMGYYPAETSALA